MYFYFMWGKGVEGDNTPHFELCTNKVARNIRGTFQANFITCEKYRLINWNNIGSTEVTIYAGFYLPRDMLVI